MKLFSCTLFFFETFVWFLFLQNGSAHRVLSALKDFRSLVAMYANHKNCFKELYLWCEGRFFEIDPARSTHAPPLKPKTASQTVAS